MAMRPLGDRVVIRPAEAKDQVKGGIIIPDTAKEKPQEGEVIVLGTGRILDDGTKVEFSVRVGDRVLFSKYGGTQIRIDEEELLVIREDDILAVLE